MSPSSPASDAAARWATVSEELERVMRTRRLTRGELARRLDVAPSTVTRLLSGGSATHMVQTLGMLAEIESALDLPKGHVLRLLGVVDDRPDIRASVVADRSLSPLVKRVILAVMDAAQGFEHEQGRASPS